MSIIRKLVLATEILAHSGHGTWQNQSVFRVVPQSRNAKRLLFGASKGLGVIYRGIRQPTDY